MGQNQVQALSENRELLPVSRMPLEESLRASSGTCSSTCFGPTRLISFRSVGLVRFAVTQLGPCATTALADATLANTTRYPRDVDQTNDLARDNAPAKRSLRRSCHPNGDDPANQPKALPVESNPKSIILLLYGLLILYPLKYMHHSHRPSCRPRQCHSTLRRHHLTRIKFKYPQMRYASCSLFLRLNTDQLLVSAECKLARPTRRKNIGELLPPRRLSPNLNRS